MRKFLVGLVIGFLLATAVGATASSNISLVINGNKIETDVPPQLIDGRVMVPAKFVAEPLGATVKWDELNKRVIITSRQALSVEPKAETNNDWVSHTNNILNRTKAIISEFQNTDTEDHMALIRVTKKFNPIIQDANAYIPPTNKKEVYGMLKEYVIAVHRHHYEITESYICRDFNDVIEYTGCVERANFYKERADSMLAGFLKYK